MPAFAGFSFSPLPEGFLPQSERVKAPLSHIDRAEQRNKFDELQKLRFLKTIARSDPTNLLNPIPQNNIMEQQTNSTATERNFHLYYIVSHIPEKVQHSDDNFTIFSLCNINKLASLYLAYLSKLYGLFQKRLKKNQK